MYEISLTSIGSAHIFHAVGPEFPSPRCHLLPIASQLGRLTNLPDFMLECWLVWSYAGIHGCCEHMRASDLSCVDNTASFQYCPTSGSSHLLIPSLGMDLESQRKKKSCFSWVSTDTYSLHFEHLCFSINHHSVHKDTSLTKSESYRKQWVQTWILGQFDAVSI